MSRSICADPQPESPDINVVGISGYHNYVNYIGGTCIHGFILYNTLS